MPETASFRSLTPTQRLLIDRILTELAPDDPALAEQARTARGSSNCACGCPSIDLVVHSSAPLSPIRRRTELFAHFGGQQLSASLTIAEGRLRDLDCASFGDESFFPPTLQNLDGWEFSTEVSTH